MKVTILTASTGNGHTSAAKALDRVFTERGVTCSTHDALDFAPFAFRKWYGDGYEFIVRVRPQLYGRLYKVSDSDNASFRLQTRNDFKFQARLRQLIEKERPDWVVCTHSLPQPRLAQLRKEFGFKIAVVVTDMYPHLMWLRGDPDIYYVPSEYTKSVLEQRRSQYEGRIVVTGIPVNPVFACPVERGEARSRLEVENGLRLVTMTSGGIGGGPFEAAVRAVAKLDTPIQLDVICGRNQNRREKMESVARELSGTSVKIRVLGQVSQEEMALRMFGSEVLISKPGGLTTSEALASGCAMLVYQPFLIPGQEEGNAEFLEQSGAGSRAHDASELVTELARLLSDPDALPRMRNIALSLGKPHAANDIVDHLMREPAVHR